MPERNLVFFSYRHSLDGEKWLKALHSALDPYVLVKNLAYWSDRDIRTGDLWHARIQEAIDRTRVAVLLINHEFFASDYICRLELPRLVADANEGKLTLICVQIGYDDPQLRAMHGLAGFQFAHDPSIPLNAVHSSRREKTLVGIAVKVIEAYGRRVDPVLTALPAFRTLQDKAIPVEPLSNNSTRQFHQLGALLDVPPLDLVRYVPRTSELEILREQLIHGLEVGITSGLPCLGLHGMGGMGKSVMAQALCHDEATRRAFPDGLAWVAFGQQPDILGLQNRLLRLLDARSPTAESPSEARMQLAARLGERCVLIVIDDLWDARHLFAFGSAPVRNWLLVTSRDATVLAEIGAQPHVLQRLSGAPARELLALRIGCKSGDLPPEADEVINHTRGLPLAQALAGAQIADGVKWATLTSQLSQGRIDFLDHAYGSVYESLGRSIDMLSPAHRERYLELAAFQEDVNVPASVVARLWRYRGNLGDADTEKLLVQLNRKALLILSERGSKRFISLHDLQLDFLRLRSDNVAMLHAHLLDAYRSTLALPEGAAAWARLPPEETYLWKHLAQHLIGADRELELEAALLSRDWIKGKLLAETRVVDGRSIADVGTVCSDYLWAPAGSAAGSVERSLWASAHVLRTYPEALDQQLFGRLGESANASLKAIAKTALARIKKEEVFIPTRAALAPLGALNAVMVGHQRPINGATVLPGGRRALSWSSDHMLRLWDLQKGGEPIVLVGHKDSVNGALVLPDSRHALSWSDDRTLRLWDLEKSCEVKVFSGHLTCVTGAVLLQDGQHALSWSRDSTLRLWDLNIGGKPLVLFGHRSGVNGAILLQDGQHVLSWSNDRTVRLWGLQPGATPKVLRGHEGRVLGVLTLSNGRQALSWSGDHTLRLWDLTGNTTPRVFAGHYSRIHGALMLPDDHRVLSWSDNETLQIIDFKDGGRPMVLVGHASRVHGALLLPGGQRALSWSADHTLRVWNLENGKELQVLAGHKGAINGALVVRSNQHVLSWSSDRTLRLWKLEQGEEPKVLAGHENAVDGALVLPDNRHALSWSSDRTLRMWDLHQDNQSWLVTGHDSAVTDALAFPDGRHAISWSDDQTLRLWDLERSCPLRVLTGHQSGITGALVLPDGQRSLSWSADQTLRLWNLEKNCDSQVLTGHKDAINGAVLVPQHQGALSWSNDGTLRLWDLEHGNGAKGFVGHEGEVKGAVLLPDGQRALSWSSDHTLRLWDLKQARPLKVLTGHKEAVVGARLLSDGLRVLSWSKSGKLRIWDLERGDESKELAGRESWIRGMLTLSDGCHALSWSTDRTLRLWKLEEGSEPKVLVGHKDTVNGALLLPDGRYALSWSNDHTLRLWDLERSGDSTVLTGHESGVLGAFLMPDGFHALSWSADRTLRLWDLATRRCVACYFADAVIKAVIYSSRLKKAWLGDALGMVQILRINDKHVPN